MKWISIYFDVNAASIEFEGYIWNTILESGTAMTRLSGQLGSVAIGREILIFKRESASPAKHEEGAVSKQPHCIWPPDSPKMQC